MGSVSAHAQTSSPASAPAKVHAGQHLEENKEQQSLSSAINMLRPNLRSNLAALRAFRAQHGAADSRVSTLALDIVEHCITPYVAVAAVRVWADDVFTSNSAALAAYEYDHYITGHTIHSRALPHLHKELATVRSMGHPKPTVLVKHVADSVLTQVWVDHCPYYYPYYYPQLQPGKEVALTQHLRRMFPDKRIAAVCTLPCGLILYCVTVQRFIEYIWLLLDPETLAGAQVLAPDPGRPIPFGQFLIDDYGHLVACDCSKLYGFSKYTMVYAQYTVPV